MKLAGREVVARLIACGHAAQFMLFRLGEVQMRVATLSLWLVLLVTLTGCELIGDIFKAGMWVGVLLVVVVLIIVGWIASKFMR